MEENTVKDKELNTDTFNEPEANKEESMHAENDGVELNEQPMADEKLSEETNANHTHDEEIEKLKSELQEAKDKYLRLYSEFENFRRRTSRERLDLIKTANEDLMVALIPVIDDFERAKKALEENKDHTTSKEGFDLIYNKFSNILTQKGLKAMQGSKGDDFNTEFHEAISQMPVDKKKLKGKIIDVVEKGYFLDEKVIRFAKVVIGA